MFFFDPKDMNQNNTTSKTQQQASEKKGTEEDTHKMQQKLTQINSEQELQIEDLFGRVYGVERVLLLKKTDTLKDVIEKITLIPECKLLYVDIEQGYPKVKNMLSLSDLFAYIATNKQYS